MAKAVGIIKIFWPWLKLGLSQEIAAVKLQIRQLFAHSTLFLANTGAICPVSPSGGQGQKIFIIPTALAMVGSLGLTSWLSLG